LLNVVPNYSGAARFLWRVLRAALGYRPQPSGPLGKGVWRLYVQRLLRRGVRAVKEKCLDLKKMVRTGRQGRVNIGIEEGKE